MLLGKEMVVESTRNPLDLVVVLQQPLGEEEGL